MRLLNSIQFTAVVLFFLSGCKDDQPVESTDIERDTLQLFGGWSGSVPVEPHADSYSFLGYSGSSWETIFTKDIESNSPSSIEIDFIPGTDLEREILFAIPHFRGVVIQFGLLV